MDFEIVDVKRKSNRIGQCIIGIYIYIISIIYTQYIMCTTYKILY